MFFSLQAGSSSCLMYSLLLSLASRGNRSRWRHKPPAGGPRCPSSSFLFCCRLQTPSCLPPCVIDCSLSFSPMPKTPTSAVAQQPCPSLQRATNDSPRDILTLPGRSPPLAPPSPSSRSRATALSLLRGSHRALVLPDPSRRRQPKPFKAPSGHRAPDTARSPRPRQAGHAGPGVRRLRPQRKGARRPPSAAPAGGPQPGSAPTRLPGALAAPPRAPPREPPGGRGRHQNFGPRDDSVSSRVPSGNELRWSCPASGSSFCSLSGNTGAGHHERLVSPRTVAASRAHPRAARRSASSRRRGPRSRAVCAGAGRGGQVPGGEGSAAAWPAPSRDPTRCRPVLPSLPPPTRLPPRRGQSSVRGVRNARVGSWVSQLGLLRQNTTDRAARATVSFFSVLEAGDLRSRCQQGCLLLRPFFLACHSSWLVEGVFSLCAHQVVPLCVCALISSSNKDTGPVGLGPIHMSILI